MALALLTSGVVLVLTCSAFLVYDFLTFRQNMVTQLSTLGAVIATNSTAALAFENREDAREILDALAAERHVESAALYDNHGELFSKYPSDLPASAFPVRPEADGFRFVHGYLTGFQPVVQGGNKRLGTLHLKANMGALSARMQLYGIIAAAVMGVSFLVAYLLSRKLQKQISEPIVGLAGAARAVSEHGDYSVRATKLGDDELGLLTDAFNQMLTRIQEQNRDIQQSELRFRSLVTATAQIVWSTDANGRIHGSLPSWQAFTEQSDDEIQGAGWAEALHPDDRPHALELWKSAVESKAPYDVEYRMRRYDGEYRYFAARAVPVLNDDGSVREWVGTCTDIHDRKLAEESIQRYSEELKRSNQELEHFAYVSSHDLQEPLRTLASFAQLLSENYRGRLDSDANEFIAFMVDGAKRMQTLIDDLLSFSRVGTRGKPLAPVACEEVMRAVLDDLEVAITESGAQVTHDPLPEVMGDDVQLRQLLQNLTGNALKFRKPDQPPHVHVSAARSGNGWHFSVRDNGIGIDPGFFDRIFIIFQRLHNRQDYAGTGIGLAVCKKIVERHGGRIWPESDPGQGSTFHFTIPDGHSIL
jgi:PAS domain S-box-containing protein